MPAGRYNIIVEQGASFVLNATYTDEDSVLVDLSGYTAVLTVAETYGGTALMELTSAGGEITLGADGTIAVVGPVAKTEALEPGERLWELVLTNAGGDGLVTRLLEGTARVTAQVAA